MHNDMSRPKLLSTEENGGGGSYFAAPSKTIEFIPTGCTLLDCVIGGGWPLGRVVNVVGDKSTGKTLQAIEAAANFHRKFPKGRIRYAESESAFDQPYAAVLGMPLEVVDFGDLEHPVFTVEEWYADLENWIKKSIKDDVPTLYILDSLDALSDKAEQEREMGEGTYGTGKAKGTSELFRRIIKLVESSKTCLMIISQIRDNIGVTFGKKYSRSGGHSLDFYASIVLWLSHISSNPKTIDGVKRITSITVKAKCEKNKISLPFRDCVYDIRFGYGIDNLAASLDWLKEVKRLDLLGITDKGMTAYLKETEALPDTEYWAAIKKVDAVVIKLWYEIEQSFMPTRSKY